MNEIPKSFNQVEKVNVSSELDSKVIDDISSLKSAANGHEDFDVTVNFMEAVADFKIELLNAYTEEELNQVPLFHHLIGSGVAVGTTFENPISPTIKLEIELAIKVFVENTLKSMLETKVRN